MPASMAVRYAVKRGKALRPGRHRGRADLHFDSQQLVVLGTTHDHADSLSR
jgi:hypothetical protein